jgi:hypothetical protein
MLHRTVAALLALAAAGTAGCGSSGSSSSAPNPDAAEKSPPGDIPDNQVYVPYRVPAGHVTLKVPEGWAQSKSGGTVTFTDKLNSIQIQSQPATGPMTVAAARHAAATLTAAKVTATQLPAGRVVLVKYLQPSKPDPVTGKATTDAVQRYVFFHNGRRAVLTLSGPKTADNVDPWNLVSRSVRWTA